MIVRQAPGRREVHVAQPEFRVLGEQNVRIEHRHGERWVRMTRTIPMRSERVPTAYRGTWRCDCGVVIDHAWRAAPP
jgi:hypothetical protein